MHKTQYVCINVYHKYHAWMSFSLFVVLLNFLTQQRNERNWGRRCEIETKNKKGMGEIESMQRRKWMGIMFLRYNNDVYSEWKTKMSGMSSYDAISIYDILIFAFYEQFLPSTVMPCVQFNRPSCFLFFYSILWSFDSHKRGCWLSLLSFHRLTMLR